MDLKHWIPKVLDNHERWMNQFGAFEPHESQQVAENDVEAVIDRLQERLTNNYPFGHPNYVGQMLKPPHPIAVLGYLSAMLINPNNHALDGGPATAQMEKEVIADLAKMFGLPQHLGHLTSSGTIANLEALWVSRALHPNKGIAFSADAHYTHSRMCEVLKVEGHKIETDARGRMDLEHLESTLKTGKIGTVVATLGTTGLGALDPLAEIVRLARHYGARIHVDTAYGGFFSIIADDSESGVSSAPYRAICDVDSLVVDPHKHGLQPYGCGAVIFSDPAVGALYKHDSPYTYFSSTELHLGEISLECSRAGAAAAGLWATLQVMPLTNEGLGKVLRANRTGARKWSDLIKESSVFTLYQEPELDIVTYFPTKQSISGISSATEALFQAAANQKPDQQIHLATYNVTSKDFALRGHELELDADSGKVLRSTVMKPESAARVSEIHTRLSELVGSTGLEPVTDGL